MIDPKDINLEVVEILKSSIQKSVKELLENKHLYQSVPIDYTPIQKLIDNAEKSPEVVRYKNNRAVALPMSKSYRDVNSHLESYRRKIQETANEVLQAFWSFNTGIFKEFTDSYEENFGINFTDFNLPTIAVQCTHCDAIRPAHNPGFPEQKNGFQEVSFVESINKKSIYCQTFVFSYQCQACKKEPLIFLVHRKGVKLKLTGRNHFETPEVPKTIPKDEKKFYAGAIVAFNTGNELSGLFMLRTTIEQYMRRILGSTEKISGEDLGDQYADLLAEDFPKSRYPSLKTIYKELSVPIHSAQSDTEQFKKSRNEIEKHFELLEHFPIEQQSV
jgi:hypothetical protein